MIPVLNRLILDSTLVDSDVTAWVAAISSAGGSVSASTVRAATEMVRALKGAGVWDKIYMLGPCAGDQLAAALVRLKVPSGVSATMANSNFIASDYTETGSNGGLAGDGSTKYLDLLLNPISQGWSDSSLMLWAYTRTAATAGTSRGTIGAIISNSGTGLGWLTSGTMETVFVGSAAAQRAQGSATSLTGLLGGGTSGSRANQFYQNGVAVGATGTGLATSENLNLFAYALNTSGTAGSYSNRRVSTMAITQGLSASEVSALYSAIAAFETKLGRNV